jgi:hypothetical protein
MAYLLPGRAAAAHPVPKTLGDFCEAFFSNKRAALQWLLDAPA